MAFLPRRRLQPRRPQMDELEEAAQLVVDVILADLRRAIVGRFVRHAGQAQVVGTRPRDAPQHVEVSFQVHLAKGVIHAGVIDEIELPGGAGELENVGLHEAQQGVVLLGPQPRPFDGDRRAIDGRDLEAPPGQAGWRRRRCRSRFPAPSAAADGTRPARGTNSAWGSPVSQGGVPSR